MEFSRYPLPTMLDRCGCAVFDTKGTAGGVFNFLPYERKGRKGKGATKYGGWICRSRHTFFVKLVQVVSSRPGDYFLKYV